MFEKKNGKRFLASVMALVMLLSLAPVGALAADETTEESPAVAQSAVEGKGQQDTEDTNENTPTEPTKDSDSAEATKSEGGLDESFSADEDDADTSNDIAVQSHSSKQPVQEQSITAEYWVTNGYAYVDGKQSMTISSRDFTNNQEKAISAIAPGEGTFSGSQTTVFWFAKVLDQDHHQVAYGEDRTSNDVGKTVEAIRYVEGTGFQNISVYITDWPNTSKSEIPGDAPGPHQVNYQVWELPSENANVSEATKLGNPVETYYNKSFTVSAIKVGMNDNEQYYIHKVTIDSTNGNYSNPVVSDSEATFELDLRTAGESTQLSENGIITINIYVTAYKYELAYVTNDGTINSSSYSQAGYYRPEDPIIAPDNVTKVGYTFVGWYKDEACTDANKWNGGDMPSRNLTLYAKWEASTTTEYTVKHFLQNLDNSSYTEDKDSAETKTGTTGQITDAKSKSYTGFTAQSFAQKTIAADGSTVVEIKYERNKHNIIYQITGENFAQNSYKTVENVPFGSTLSLISDDMTKDEYTFSGWKGLPDTMPDNDVTVTGYYTKNDVGPVDPPTDPGTDLVDAMYFVLMPGQGVPNSGVSRGVDKYFPNASNNGGVTGKSNTTGYEGKITKAATELTGANTSNGYFNKNGVGDQYLKDIGDLGYFNGSNYTDGKYKDTLPDGLKDFNMTNKEIVWYVIKKEGNDYHVDGYVKGVNIELKYFDEFDGTQIGETTSLLSGGTATIKNPDVTHDGWKFAGWFTKDGTKYEVNSTHTLIDSLNLYARWTTTYSVVTHFMGANGIEQENLSQTSNNLTGTHGKLLSELVVQPDMENITGNYVYVPSETKYSVGNGDKVPVGTTTFTTANTVIHQYYYLDETGETGKDKENKPTDKPDGIPDAWQHKVTFKVVNGKWNDDSSDNIVVYVNAKDKDGETLESKLTEAQIPAVGEKPNSGYRASGSWDKSLSAGLKITGDTEFTFTYSRRSSGGSSRPSTPTVTIPDDVPTGLNGKDHYAYIIGYGNNDVRPQNNITRAEVATIFFRLLTDETREANMTKSNGYNDVKDGDWFCCAVSTLSKMGIIKGYEDGSFKPNDPISRAEFAAIAARFDPDGDKTPATFADITSHWAKDEISIAANHGWIKGYEDGSFKPDQKITRAETMTLVNRVLNRLPEAKDDLHKDMKTWVDNMDETAWYYLAVQEATNSHYFKNKTGTKFEQWTDLRDTRDWSELEK